MDELTALKSFRAERDAEPAEAREAIWLALEARIEAAASESRAFGESVAGSTPPPREGARRRGLFGGRRPLAFAGAATAMAAVVAGVLVVSSGPNATPASAAEILHEAADSAAAAGGPTSMVPGPGEYLYSKEQWLGIQGWRYPTPPATGPVPTGSIGGTLHGPHAYNALVPTTFARWTDDDGGGRTREEIGTPDFWSAKEEARWKAAGSPLPGTGQAVNDTEHPGYGPTFHFPDTSNLPTEAAALRQTVEAGDVDHPAFNPVAHGPLDQQQTKEELLNILQEGEPSTALQAAIFDALAELPGIEVRTGVTDALGRDGDAITTSTSEGVRSEYLFDPAAGVLLATRGVLLDPSAVPGLEGIPAGTTISERDFLEKAVVDSTHDTGQGAEAEAG
jgi:hypothetical protein